MKTEFEIFDLMRKKTEKQVTTLIERNIRETLMSDFDANRKETDKMSANNDDFASAPVFADLNFPVIDRSCEWNPDPDAAMMKTDLKTVRVTYVRKDVHDGVLKRLHDLLTVCANLMKNRSNGFTKLQFLNAVEESNLNDEDREAFFREIMERMR